MFFTTRYESILWNTGSYNITRVCTTSTVVRVCTLEFKVALQRAKTTRLCYEVRACTADCVFVLQSMSSYYGARVFITRYEFVLRNAMLYPGVPVFTAVAFAHSMMNF